MSDQGVREIQLSGKQLVFMFMTATVAAVVIFLCGVMVGRGVNTTRASAAAAVTTEPAVDPTSSSPAPPRPHPTRTRRGTGFQSGRPQGTDLRQALEAPEPPPEPAVEPVARCPLPRSPSTEGRSSSGGCVCGQTRGSGRAERKRLRRAGRFASFTRRSRRHRAPSLVEGLSLVRHHSGLERSDACSACASASTRAPRGRNRRQKVGKGRTVQALDHPLSYFLSALSGALLALSFPRYGHPAFAWIALVPLLLAFSGWRGRQALPGSPSTGLWLGMTAGLVYFTGTVYWTSSVLAVFGGMPMILAVVAMLLLAAYLAIYPAITAMVLARLIAQAADPRCSSRRRLGRDRISPWVPVRWLSLGALGNARSRAGRRAARERARCVRVSALVAFVNASIAFALLSTGRARAGRHCLHRGLAPGHRGVGFVAGGQRIADARGDAYPRGADSGNVAQEENMSPTPQSDRRIFTTYLAMTRDAVRRGAEYIIWPIVDTVHVRPRPCRRSRAPRAGAGSWCADSVRQRSNRGRTRAPPVNTAFLLGPDGETAAVYRKIHLVPFGEFFPMQEWLTFAAPLVRRFLPFTPVDTVVILPVRASRRARDLLRGGFPVAHSRCGLAGEPAAVDGHQRRLVRDLVCPGPALRDGGHARNRRRPLHGARREHRNQRRGRSVRGAWCRHRRSLNRSGSWPTYAC